LKKHRAVSKSIRCLPDESKVRSSPFAPGEMNQQKTEYHRQSAIYQNHEQQLWNGSPKIRLQVSKCNNSTLSDYFDIQFAPSPNPLPEGEDLKLSAQPVD